jgi:hypothetical protein
MTYLGAAFRRKGIAIQDADSAALVRSALKQAAGLQPTGR